MTTSVLDPAAPFDAMLSPMLNVAGEEEEPPKRRTPSQHARLAFETVSTFEDAVDFYATGALIDPVYYILGGAKSGEGAVVTRDRKEAADIWRLNASEPDGWFRLETNYDHWLAVPSYDDRRDPGNAHMKALGRDNVSTTTMWSILEQWPTFNLHTDFSAVMSATDGTFQTTVWVDDDSA